MKKIILSLILLVGWSQLFSQTHTSAFFVYRNDMPVTPFFFESVDSIRQSRIDLDSIERPEFVVTEFWTPDSVHRVPIAVIDSIAFTTPSEIRKPGSVEITDEQFSYLLEVDSLTLKFSPSIPQRLLPKKGEKLTYLNVNRILPNGFLGMVRDVVSSDSGIFVECDSIGITDAFDRLYQVGDYVCEESDYGKSMVSRTTSEGKKYIKISPIKYKLPFYKDVFTDFTAPINKDWDFGISANEIEIEFEWIPSGHYLIIHEDYTPIPSFYIDFSSIGRVVTSANVNGSFSFNPLSNIPKELLESPLPIPPCPAIFNLIIRPEISLSGDIALSFRREDSVDFGFNCRYSTDSNIKNEFSFKKFHINHPDIKIDLLSANMTFSAGLYGALRVLKVGYIGAAMGIDINSSFLVGRKDFELAEKRSSFYDRFNMEKTVTAGFFGEPRVELSFENMFAMKAGWKTNLCEVNLPTKKFFPDFSQLKYIEDKADTRLECDVDGLLFIDVEPGLKVVDENDNVIFKEFHYQKHIVGTTHMEFPYLHKAINKRCTLYPIFRIFDREITASPSYPLYLKVTPVTDSSVAGSGSARLNGHLDMNSQTLLNLTAADCKVGFCYSTSSMDVHNGSVVNSDLQADRTFTADLSGLEIDTDYYYCAFISTENGVEYGEVLSFSTKESEEVDLGLSVNWRAWNVGAEHAHECGNHYAWGEISTKNNYSWDSYFDNPYTQGDVWKGCDLNSDISGSMVYDPSRYLKDNGWRMPTREEMQELLEKCKWEWTTVEDVNGYNVTGPNGNSIFLPANGLADNNSITNEGTYGAYWTSTPQSDTEGKATAATLYFYGGMLKSLQWANRYGGRAVRPVKDR